MTAERRARRLLHWYPHSWRERYGEEFSALLVDSINADGLTLHGAFDIARAGCVARWRAGGLARESSANAAPGAELAWVLGATGVFLFLANGVWSQLEVDWQWGRPWDVATMVGFAVMTISLGTLVLAIIGLCCAAVVGGLRAGAPSVRRLVVPVGVAAAGWVVFVAGAVHFAARWPGTGAHPWSLQGVIPGGVGAFSWSATLSLTTYWFHPNQLAAFPTSEVLWMAISPLAVLAAIGGSAAAVTRLRVHSSKTSFESGFSGALGLSMVTFAAGAAIWLADGATGQPHLMFHKGLINVLELLALSVAVLVVRRASLSVTAPNDALGTS